jgi:hypothetical protein
MLTEKYVFRPAWLRTVGPGLVLAMLISALIVVATNHEVISPGVALRLHLVPNLVLLGFCARGQLQGSVVVKPNQVVLQGWAKVTGRRGRSRLVQIKHAVPRDEWGTIAVDGLFTATVTCACEGGTIVVERLGRPDLLRKLLAAPSARYDSLLPLGPLPLALIVLAKALKLAIAAGIAAVARLCPAARPHLTAAARWTLGLMRRAIRTLGVHLVALSGGSSSLALEYARFVAFCRHYLLGRRLAVVKGDLAAFYWKTLREACVVYGQAPSTWMLHPRVQSIEDIKQRIPQRAFERMWFDNLLQDIDSVALGPGEPTCVPLILHQAR